MRGVALALWGLGALAGLYLSKATSPALEASHRLSADRWRQGQAPYEVLQAPVDPCRTLAISGWLHIMGRRICFFRG